MGVFIAIDLKSFFASVECVERHLDPLQTNLLVADVSRTNKTICLAVSPSLKSYGIGGRARLFEVEQRLRQVNEDRRYHSYNYWLNGKSYHYPDLIAHPDWEVDYIAAPPRMSYYIKYSTKIYEIYLRYIAAEDIHVYSIDEVFIDATNYLKSYRMTAHQLAMTLIHEVLKETGITATAGIGTNLYLCKIAMDIVAKHIPADKDGVRIAELDEISYREKLWSHQPLTSFWRVGKGIANKLAQHGLFTMGDLARFSLNNEETLFKLFGVNAELLIDHAWGYEPCTMADIKAYKPQSTSLSNAQVLTCPYTADKARIVAREMADNLSLNLVDKKLITSQLTLTIVYEAIGKNEQNDVAKYEDETLVLDYYGRLAPKPSQGSIRLPMPTSSSKIINTAIVELYEKIVDPNKMVRRIGIGANTMPEEIAETTKHTSEQLNLFVDYEALEQQRQQQEEEMRREKKVQQTLLDIKKKFGKNAILRGTNYEEGATARERNNQIGGHKA